MGLIELTFPNFLKALLLWTHLDQQKFHVEGENRSSLCSAPHWPFSCSCRACLEIGMMGIKCQRGLSLVVSTGSKDKLLSLPCAIMRHLTPEYRGLNWETCACSVGRLRGAAGGGAADCCVTHRSQNPASHGMLGEMVDSNKRLAE